MGHAWEEMLGSLCPECLAKLAPELSTCAEPATLSLFETLVLQIGQELQELGGGEGEVLAAQASAAGYQYKVQDIEHCTDLAGLMELWRFGVALNLDAHNLESDVQEKAQALLIKEVQGAWRVAKRRSKSFARSSGKLSPAGQGLRVQVRRVESALSIILSDHALLCSRADLATDWLEGVDLWLHRPKTAASKGRGLAISLLKSRRVEQKKIEAQSGMLWTPHRLADRLGQALGASGADPAQGCWEALGKPVDPEVLAQRLRSSLLDLGKLRRKVHPASSAPMLVRWLRELRKALETK